MSDHRDTVAVITGGGQGLGLAIAEALASQGCTRLLLVGRDEAKLRAAARPLGAEVFAADLADAATAHAMIDTAAARFGRVTSLVNAAASTDRGSILDTTEAAWDAHMAVNAKAPFFALQRLAQRAIEAGHPATCVNILSMVIHAGQSFLAPYSASKAALANVTKNSANALRSHRIRVNAINPGWMDTPGEDAVQRRHHGATDGWLARAEAAAPMGMLVKPAHVAELAAYLLSDRSGVMTGALIDFDQNVAGAYPE